MRLLKARTEHLEFEEFSDQDLPFSAILSHTWGEEEVSLQDILWGKRDIDQRAGFIKIMQTRKLAAKHGDDTDR
ncbi:hypothetical protein QBC35DRAFT_392961 [Podospora australis]|uniref:Uncharacterized protein n=1 Tax=Podospora australis TaxID=1536484 RepID=A0AAN7AFE5_9PEZI|nr:hypothetical protein QBC35DRAFT_392961 [Podospora australis]